MHSYQSTCLADLVVELSLPSSNPMQPQAGRFRVGALLNGH